MKRAPGTGFSEMIFPGGTHAAIGTLAAGSEAAVLKYFRALRPNQNHTKELCNRRRVHFDAGNRRTNCKLALPVKLPLVVLPVIWVFAFIDWTLVVLP
jgi:hypothetical protein